MDSSGRRAAHGLKLALLEHTQELRLKFKRHVPNFIEEESAAIRQCKTADVRINGARKGSAFMSEELAFEKAGSHGGTVHLHQISASPGAEIVNPSRDDLPCGCGL